MEFKPLEAKDEAVLQPYFDKREILSCEYCFATLLLWNNMYNITYHVEEHYALFMEEYKGEIYAIMPMCEVAYFEEAFDALKGHFESLGLPLIIYVADPEFAEFIEEKHKDIYEVSTNRDEYDYLYDGEALRTLAGKKLRKKRNHVNGFLRDYEDRWHFTQIKTNENRLVCNFMHEWAINKGETEEMLDHELVGVCDLLEHIETIDVTIGGLYIDDKLAALTLASTMNNGKEAVIHIEKADPTIRGLYQMINQQFLINCMPDVEIVNREDDVGIEGLRKAKLSYYPTGFAEKYSIKER